MKNLFSALFILLLLAACTRGPIGKLGSLYWYHDYGIPSKTALQDRQYVPNLANAVKDDNPRVGIYAVKALRRMGPAAERSLPTLAEAAKSDLNIKVRYQAIVALTEIDKQSPFTYETLSSLMLSGEPAKVRETAGKWMTTVGASAAPAVPSLLQALDSRYPKVRNYAVIALGRIGPLAQAALPALEKVARDDDRKTVRDSAAEAIRQINDGK